MCAYACLCACAHAWVCVVEGKEGVAQLCNSRGTIHALFYGNNVPLLIMSLGIEQDSGLGGERHIDKYYFTKSST